MSSDCGYWTRRANSMDAWLGQINRCDELERDGLGEYWSYSVLVRQQACILDGLLRKSEKSQIGVKNLLENCLVSLEAPDAIGASESSQMIKPLLNQHGS